MNNIYLTRGKLCFGITINKRSFGKGEIMLVVILCFVVYGNISLPCALRIDEVYRKKAKIENYV